MGMFKEIKGMVSVNSETDIEQVKTIANDFGVVTQDTTSDDTVEVEVDVDMCKELFEKGLLSDDELNDIDSVDIIMFYIN